MHTRIATHLLCAALAALVATGLVACRPNPPAPTPVPPTAEAVRTLPPVAPQPTANAGTAAYPAPATSTAVAGTAVAAPATPVPTASSVPPPPLATPAGDMTGLTPMPTAAPPDFAVTPPATATLVAGQGPQIAFFHADVAYAQPGQAVTLTWQSSGADTGTV